MPVKQLAALGLKSPDVWIDLIIVTFNGFSQEDIIRSECLWVPIGIFENTVSVEPRAIIALNIRVGG